MYDDIRIRKVGVLGDRAKRIAQDLGCKDDDLVIVKTFIHRGRLPTYKLEKIEGDPIRYLLKRMSRKS